MSAGMVEPGVAVVTGGASGIGRSVVEELTGRGWAVASLDLQAAPAAAHSAQVDVTDTVAMAQAVREVEERLGPVGACVSVAGHYEMVPVAQISPEQWHRMLRVHLSGLVNLARATLPGMLERRSGSVVAIASELAVGGGAEDAHYAAAKGAVLGLVRSLAAEVAAAGGAGQRGRPRPDGHPADRPGLALAGAGLPRHAAAAAPGHPRGGRPLRGLPGRRGTFCVGEVLTPNAGAVI